MKTAPIDPRTIVALVVAAGAALAGAPARGESDRNLSIPAGAAPSTLDEQARDLFRSQRYGDALAIYQRLRVETGHPTYLRNIGRCHQMMRRPALAIDAFQTYLNEAHDLNPGERTEIEGYIGEMRRLELSTAPPAGGGGSEPAIAPMAGPTAAAASALPGPSAGSSIVHRWWFWTGVGVLLAATGIIVVASSGQDRLPCPTGAQCP